MIGRALRPGLMLVPLAFVAGCGPVSPERAAEICEEKARAAQGPTGRVTIGVNSDDGPFVSGEIGVTGDYLAGRDPMIVYRDCVIARTGQEPIRPPVLRE